MRTSVIMETVLNIWMETLLYLAIMRWNVGHHRCIVSYTENTDCANKKKLSKM